MVIGKFLTLAECCKSATAIKMGIDNVPNEMQVQAMKDLCKFIYDPLCEHFATKIPFNSFFRCDALNKAIKGAKGSQHTMGEAIDMDFDGKNIGVTNQILFDYIRFNMTFDQLIWEFDGAWVHCSWSDSHQPRMQVLKAVNKGNKTTYQQHG